MDKEAINELAKQFGVAIDWSQENIMPQINDLINRYAQYRITVDTIWCVVCAVIIIATIVVVAVILWRNRGYNDAEFICFVMMIASLIIGTLGIALGACIEAVVGWKCCPEVMILKNIND